MRLTSHESGWSCIFILAVGCAHIVSSFNLHYISLSHLRIDQSTYGGSRRICNDDKWRRLSHNGNVDEGESLQMQGEIQSDLAPKQESVPRQTPTPRDISQAMRMMGTSPRRVFLSALSSTLIALVANLFGVTSSILSQLPAEFSEQTGLDFVYPRNGFKRVVARSSTGGGGKASFLIPKDWVADTGLALAQAQRQARALDLSMNTNARGGVLPDAAFGPPGKLDSQGLSNGDTNVSIIINSGVKNFSLRESFGEPSAAADKLILSRIKRPTTLLSAADVQNSDISAYQFEYIVDRGENVLPLRSISIVAAGIGGNSYITLTVVSPSPEWDKPAVEMKLRKIVNSLSLFA